MRFDQTADAVDAALALERGEGHDEAERARAWERAEAAFVAELTPARLAMRRILADERVREALFLSSPEFFRNIVPYVEQPCGERKSRGRQKEKTAARYLQRFFAKNETISFFGPLAWGRFDPSLQIGVSFTPGPEGILSKRRVSFEYWAIHSLAKVIAADPDVADQLPPRLSPTCHVDGVTLLYPVGRTAEIDPRRLAVIERADGHTPWRSVIEGLADHPAFADPGPSPAEVAQDLLDRRILSRELPVPTVIANPERVLHARVDALDEPARSRWEPRVRAMCEQAERLAAAALPERMAILSELGREFSAITGAEPSRRAGQMYAARTLVYEDCQRDVRDLVVGGPIARRLQGLAPLLDIARWVTLELPRRYHDRFLDVHRRLSGGLGAVDFIEFVRETEWLAADDDTEQELREDIEAAWLDVLGDRWDGAAHTVELTGDDCRAALARLDEDGAASAASEILGANFLSPDFLLAGSLDELRRGGGMIVMGELHKAVLLAAQPVALPFCPDRDELFEHVRRAVVPPVVSLVDPPRAYVRSAANWPDLPEFYEVLTEGATSRFPPERVIPAGALEVIEEDGELFVARRDGSLRSWLFSVLSGFLYKKLLAVDPIELSSAYTPRLVLDGIVVSRRRWRVTTDELCACRAGADSAARLGAARRFRRRLGMPERVFVKSPNEQKPIFVDFRSYFLVELLFKLAGEAPTLTISEMLPDADQLWLTDAHGGRYTSEIRTSFYLSR